MANIFRQRVVWTGFVGAPGLSTFYFSDASVNQGALKAFFDALRPLLPPVVTTTIQPGGDVIEATSGTLTGSWVGTVQAASIGTASPPDYAAPVGALCRWETATVVAGSRLRGRTYIVPASRNAYAEDGTLSVAAKGILDTATFDLVAAVTPSFVVWQRPRAATPQWTDVQGRIHPARSTRAGSTGVVIGQSVPDLAVVLRSRRD